MNLIDHDTEGRAVVQHFFTELEKIAYSSKVRTLYRAAGGAEKQVGEAAEALGASRFIPFTKAHRAYYGHAGVAGSGVKGRARLLASQAEQQAGKERSVLLGALGKGKGNQENIIQRLKDGPQKTGPVQRAKRAVGMGGAVEEPTFASKKWSPLARKAMIGTGVAAAGVAGAGGLYAGNQYLNGQQQNYDY